MNSDFANAKRKHAEKSTNRSRDHYLTLLDKLPALIWRSGVDAQCDYFNQTWLDFTGRSLDQEMGDGWTVAVHPEDLAGCLQSYLKAFHSRQPFTLEYRLRRHDGEYRWVLDQGRAFNDLEGRFAGYLGSCFDITERKSAEMDSLRLAAIVNSSDDAIIGKNLNSVITSWNRGAEKIFGYSAREMMGASIMRLIPSDRRDDENQILRKIKRGESMEHFETLRQTKNGRLINVSITVSPIKDADGKIIGVSKVVRDITERKQVEQAQRASETRCRRLVDSNAQGVIFWNKKGGITGANDAFLKLVRYTRADLKAGRLNWAAMTPPEYAHLDRRALEEIASTGIYATFEKEYFRSDGSRVPILVGAAVFEDNPDEGVAFVIDLTERKAAEKALRNSREQLRALYARLQSVREQESERIAREIHDELGQALTSLNMDLIWIQQKLEEEKSPLLRSQFKRRMKAMTALLATTVRSVQRISTELRPHMLYELGLAATLEWQAEEFEKRTGIHCRWKPKPAAAQLKCDQATALFRIFQEILNNVGRHAQARSVRLKLVRSKGEMILEVADDGRGFNEKKLLSHKSLGLLGMRERAAFIGGRVEIRSAPRKGTTVTVTSPVVESGKRRKLKADSSCGKKNKISHRR